MSRSVLATLAAAAVVVGGFAAPASAAPAGSPPECQTIVEIAADNPDFSTLVAALTAADLVDTLNGDGPFTVFAPTNAAFDALPEGTVDSLLADPSGALTDVLLLHVISGEVGSEAAVAAAGTNVETLGGPVAVALDGETLTVGGAPVTTTDIEACNGIVHVLGGVITAPADVPADPEPTTPTTEAPAPTPTTEAPAAAPAAEMPMPTRVDTGDSGLAATSGGSNTLLALLVGTAVLGLGGSVLLRTRRQD